MHQRAGSIPRRRTPPRSSRRAIRSRRSSRRARPFRRGAHGGAQMKSPIRVRPAVERMRPYHPPLEGRTDKLRLDFNENPIGCSPVVRRALAKLSAASIASYPEQETVRRKAARHFGVRPEELLLTNGTDEALSLVVSTFVEPRDTVLLVEPTYAMYRFYSRWPGAGIWGGATNTEMCFPGTRVLAALRAGPPVFFCRIRIAPRATCCPRESCGESSKQ